MLKIPEKINNKFVYSIKDEKGYLVNFYSDDITGC